MTTAELLILIVALIVGVALLIRLAGGFFGTGTVGDRSHRGRLRSRAERDSIERDQDLWSYSSRGGHHQEPPGMRKPPDEGGLL
jgi:hypothetical protein